MNSTEAIADLEAKLAKWVSRAEYAESVLEQLEGATTNFVLGSLKLAHLPPKKELEALLPILTKVRRLLERIP